MPLYAGLAALLLAGIAFQSWSRFVTHPAASVAAPDAPSAPAVSAELTPAQTPVIDMTAQPVVAAFPLDTIDVVVGRNDTLDRIFRRLDLNLTDLASIRLLPGIRQGLDLLRPGDQITVTHSNGDLQGLTRQISLTQTLSVKRDGEGFAAQIIDNPVETTVVSKRARISSSLFESAAAAGISDQTALALANIFGWDIDFVLDIRDGDEFSVIYEQIWQDGELVGDGAIVAAQFVNDGRTFRAVRYQLPDGSWDYFAPDGRSMHKAFLRAPVDFTRISSRFNSARQHPILNTIRAHKGVDYAAPTGTPVRAAGDGRVQTRGRYGGYGNAIVLEHGSGVSTLYGHLSRFAKGVAPGARVRQGQVIGYVGMTGLATGPHLHYEYRVNGVHRNPQTVKLADATPIAADLRADFQMRTAPDLAQLDQLTSNALLANR
ncbi:MAG TPA: peptidoglycan DD-metalloendopeptidase family protein [Steroidobacteraceae bacterium]|nr:peptidoglycan DD-metalloendopeptidase family protein [Steroidobacteraceae bacterium]